MRTVLPSYVRELLKIVAADGKYANIAVEDILNYVQKLEDIAVQFAVYIAEDKE